MDEGPGADGAALQRRIRLQTARLQLSANQSAGLAPVTSSGVATAATGSVYVASTTAPLMGSTAVQDDAKVTATSGSALRSHRPLQRSRPRGLGSPTTGDDVDNTNYRSGS